MPNVKLLRMSYCTLYGVRSTRTIAECMNKKGRVRKIAPKIQLPRLH